MHIYFRLEWLKSGDPVRKAFKLSPHRELMEEYTNRISKWSNCSISGTQNKKEIPKNPASRIWICDRNPGSHSMSSEALASHLEKTFRSGIRELHIVIGGPDGISAAEIKRLEPDLRWSFGPLTLPHELAAVVAAEQIYRALTILHRLPYHLGH